MTTTNEKSPTPEQFSRIRLLVLDVDGVLTDGRLHYDADGHEAKVFHVRDGHGIKQVAATGIAVAVISGRSCRAVETRMAELDIKYVRLGQDDKLSALREITDELAIPMDAVACVGDDIPDLPIMNAAGLGIAVADAHPTVRDGADWCTSLNGGRGAVREVCDLLTASRQ
jgi:3-deoxy-D-manno-octulosonate 8-phosphate phosphatase (KDO 8-P phosphatase)